MLEETLHESSGAPVGGMSLVRGGSAPPLVRQTIPGLLRETVAAHGDRPALVLPAQGIDLAARLLR